MNEFVQAVSTVGFPIVCCGVLMVYVKSSTDKFTEKVETLTKRHYEETKELYSTINNNTLALQELTNYIKKEGEK